EQHLGALPGVQRATVNYARHRARVRWDPDQQRASRILTAFTEIGYRAWPDEPGRRRQVAEVEYRALLQRFLVAGLLAAQIMMLSAGLYMGDAWGIEPGLRNLLRWAAALLAVPVLGYAAQPFFAGAWRDLRLRRAGMDVPIALAMALAFGASMLSVGRGHGEVYFDSLAMFAAFLLGARTLETAVRRRAGAAIDRLAGGAPASAQRRTAAGWETVLAARLVPGDEILVRPGEAVPADAELLSGRGSLDESLLSGESRPVSKAPGSTLLAGSLNGEQPLTARVLRSGEATLVAGIRRLADAAVDEKPRLARLADRVAAPFVLLVLAAGLGTFLLWQWLNPATALPATIAVLVVACPCALSLATPAALAAATGHALGQGILVARSRAFEVLTRADHWVFDKTGTLTSGRPLLTRTQVLGPLSAAHCLRLAAALEQFSAHPLATAIREAANGPLPEARDVVQITGQGIRGQVDGQTLEVRRMDPDSPAGDGAELSAELHAGDQALARFYFSDPPHPQARQVLTGLAGLHRSLLSGDRPAAVKRFATGLGFDEVRGGLAPRDKQDFVRDAQARGSVVAMVGDGVNDTPVLAQADVSLAIGQGAPLAARHADVVLLRGVAALPATRRLATRTTRVIYQNLGWALAYNLVAIPLAMAGWVPPWLAAIGMSLSSVLVVLNALRLQR
ncbi:MAG: cadmium-translocating P-type ATPase, partial [Gammaproteobacteria bacterium]|nr:cadmium-translocating P-type ATPase [Gammaproteobacteria bacterium]